MNAVESLPVQYAQPTSMQALVPRNVAEAIALSEVLSKAKLVPEHLQGKPGDCLLIVMQAQRWGMDALSVASCTSVVKGKLCYEGKLVAAMLYSMGAVQGRLRYEFTGNGANRGIKISGKVRGETVDQVVEGTVAGWKTDNGNWTKNPDDMLVYRGTRQWARRYTPEALLGVYTPDEMEEIDITPKAEGAPASVVAMPKAKVVAQPAIEGKSTHVDRPEPNAELEAVDPNAAAGIYLDASPRKMLLAKGAQAGFDEEALVIKFGRIDSSTINGVLASLRSIAEAQE